MGLTATELDAYIDGLDLDSLYRLEAEVAAIEKDQRDRPLAYARLWDREPPRTSQLRNAVARMYGGHLYRFELGGNRTGKSEGGAQEDWVYALGRDHPDVIAWAANNGIDLDLTDIPSGPGTVWAVAPDSNDSRRFVRPKIAKYAPTGCRWRNRDGSGEAECIAPSGAKIVFKSVDQGRDGFQGDAVRRVRFDEEPRDSTVVNESLMRIADCRGHLAFTMTPLSGWTKLLEDHVRDPDDDTVVSWLYGGDNPHVDPEFLQRLYRKFGEHERAARERGAIVAMEGRVYDFHRHLHVIPSFRPPDDWPRWAAWDFGTSNPTAIVWMALDPSDNVLHLYRCHYEANQTTAYHAGRFKQLSEGETIQMVVCDPENRDARLSLVREHGIVNVGAKKGPGSVRAGINRIAERLAPDAEGKPHLLVHDCCAPLISEFESYVWDTTKRKGDLPDMPLKKNDHALDALRYVVSYLAQIGYGMSSSTVTDAE